MYKLAAIDSIDSLELESKDKKMHNILKPYIRKLKDI
jgi:hypothetical protein